MTHPIEFVSALVVVAVLLFGTATVLPRPKPTPPIEKLPVEQSIDGEPASQTQAPERVPVIAAEPMPQSQVDKQNVEQTKRDLRAAQRDIDEIKKVLKEQRTKRGDDGT